MGVVQVVSGQTHSLLWGKQDECQVWRGHHHAQHILNNRCTNQSHLLSISLTFSLDALPAAHFFHPWNGTDPPVLTGATKALGSAGRTSWLLLCILPEKTKGYISLNHISKQYHLSQTLVGTPSSTYCNDQICLSTFQEYI